VEDAANHHQSISIAEGVSLSDIKLSWLQKDTLNSMV